MAATFEPQPSGVEEVHILWISEGMSCDGDTVSITAGTLPALEEVLLGLIPGLPKVHLHNKVLSPTLGFAQEQGDWARQWLGDPHAQDTLLVQQCVVRLLFALRGLAEARADELTRHAG